jgi:aryl-alcohol dehydrogenase-like predicted oxidoreductase
MHYRKLGRTSLEISEIAFGTGDTAGAIIHGDTRYQREIVAAALERGINVFDTSPDYGKGTAEVNLGRVLRDVGAQDAALVMSKVEIMPEHIQCGRIAERVTESIDDSLTRLGRDHLDVVFLHNPSRPRHALKARIPWTPLTPDEVIEQVIPALQRAREAGKARYLGVACERADVSAVRQILAADLVDAVIFWFNLANPSLARSSKIPGVSDEEDYAGFLDLATEAGVGVAAIRPLAGGALTSGMLSRGANSRHELSRGIFTWQPEVFEPERLRGRRFAFLDRPGEQAIAQAAYRYLLGHPQITTVIGGFSGIEHLDDAVAASAAGSLSEADMAAIDRVIDGGFTDPGEASVDWYGAE